jgi:glycosyltransferase involved in cell wall biosynthesis
MLLNHKELAENMGQKGRIYVKKNHNWLKVADNLYSLFKNLIHN